MSNTIKVLFITLSACFVVGNVGAAPPDAHEQARQLLQRPAVTAKTQPAVDVVRVAPDDAHEQARRLLDRSEFVAEKGNTSYEVPVLAAKAGEFVDAHVRASGLLAKPLAIE